MPHNMLRQLRHKNCDTTDAGQFYRAYQTVAVIYSRFVSKIYCLGNYVCVCDIAKLQTLQPTACPNPPLTNLKPSPTSNQAIRPESHDIDILTSGKYLIYTATQQHPMHLRAATRHCIHLAAATTHLVWPWRLPNVHDPLL